MKLEEVTLQNNRVYDGKILKLDVDTIQQPDGRVSKREIVRHKGGAAVFFVKDGRLALVKQFRYAYRQAIYEIPAGKLEPNEPPEVTAKRELEEETGYVAPSLTLMGKLYPTPGYTDEIIYIYLAKEATFTQMHLDEGENLTVTFMPMDEVLTRIRSGEICDAKTVYAVYRYLYENDIK